MSVTFLPFLYQTRTLARALNKPVASQLARHVRAYHQEGRSSHDSSVPFEWDEARRPKKEGKGADVKQSTITPSEVQVFKGIFDEIAQGKMAQSKKRSPLSEEDALDGEEQHQMQTARSIVEEVRITQFREKFLQRYPVSLRNAAQVALGLYSTDPQDSDVGREVNPDAEKKSREERARVANLRREEYERVIARMKSCTTDTALWKVMEEEVFSLPTRLGIAKKTGRTKPPPPKEEKVRHFTTEQSIMDIHGPLYPHFISTSLELLDTAFARSSPYVFEILPRVKTLGLTSYVLAVSTQFYSKLARIHWERFGDANSALDALQEMNSAGLYANREVLSVLSKMRDDLDACTVGDHGAFSQAMTEVPPYDGSLTQRLDDTEWQMRQSIKERSA